MVCNMCKQDRSDVRKRRQNTAYKDDCRNWDTLCDECQEEANSYWQEMWMEYHTLVR